jgi:hypothetical protein
VESVAVATPDGGGVQRVDILLGDDLRFVPSFVQAHPGVVEFVYHNNGAASHDVLLDG